MVKEIEGDRGAEGVDGSAGTPGIPCPRQRVEPLLEIRQVDVDRLLEATTEILECVAGAEHVVGVRTIEHGQLRGPQPIHEIFSRVPLRSTPHQQIGNLDRITPRPDQFPLNPRPIHELFTVKTPLQYLPHLPPRAAGKARRRGGEVLFRCFPGAAVAEFSGGVAYDDGVLVDVLGDYGAGADDAVGADGDAVHDDDVRADPDVVADGDAEGGVRLLEDRPVRAGAVVEGDQRGVRPDPDPVTQRDPAADHRERVDRRVRAHFDRAGDVGVGADVRPLPHPQFVAEHRRRLRHIDVLAELGLARRGQFALPLGLLGPLRLTRAPLVLPGQEVETADGGLRAWRGHGITLSETRDKAHETASR